MTSNAGGSNQQVNNLIQTPLFARHRGLDRLKDLERENATLKRLLADAELEKDALREIAKGNF